MKVVIMAGGMGSRISSISGNLPKPMLPILGKPVLEHEIESLRDQGFVEILLTIGHKAEAISSYFGDGSGISPATGKPFGVNIRYFYEEKPLGNAGALYELKDWLTEDFLLLNGDSVFDVDFSRFLAFHRSRGAKASIFTHPNSHPYDSALLVTDEKGSVLRWLEKGETRQGFYKNSVNAGLHILSPSLLSVRPDKEKVDLDKDILKKLGGSGELFAYSSPEYVKDMGTPERYEAVIRDFSKKIPEKRNLRNRQRIIFMDRDGTLNRYKGFLRSTEEMELLPKVSEAVRRINESPYLSVVVTNQPVIARGEVTEEGLREIHNKMETLLGADGAYIDDLFYCPHHPDSGFEGEVKELKIDCECRKPKPGMLLRAAEKYNASLPDCWMIGDSRQDILAGKNAGVRTALISDAEEDFGQDIRVRSLYEFTEVLFGEEEE